MLTIPPTQYRKRRVPKVQHVTAVSPPPPPPPPPPPGVVMIVGGGGSGAAGFYINCDQACTFTGAVTDPVVEASLNGTDWTPVDTIANDGPDQLLATVASFGGSFVHSVRVTGYSANFDPPLVWPQVFEFPP